MCGAVRCFSDHALLANSRLDSNEFALIQMRPSMDTHSYRPIPPALIIKTLSTQPKVLYHLISSCRMGLLSHTHTHRHTLSPSVSLSLSLCVCVCVCAPSGPPTYPAMLVSNALGPLLFQQRKLPHLLAGPDQAARHSNSCFGDWIVMSISQLEHSPLQEDPL